MTVETTSENMLHLQVVCGKSLVHDEFAPPPHPPPPLPSHETVMHMSLEASPSG